MRFHKLAWFWEISLLLDCVCVTTYLFIYVIPNFLSRSSTGYWRMKMHLLCWGQRCLVTVAFAAPYKFAFTLHYESVGEALIFSLAFELVSGSVMHSQTYSHLPSYRTSPLTALWSVPAGLWPPSTALWTYIQWPNLQSRCWLRTIYAGPEDICVRRTFEALVH